MFSYLGVGIPGTAAWLHVVSLNAAVRLSAEFRCVRTLALEMAEPQVKPVAHFLRCFPCLEMLCVTSHMVVPQSMEILNYEMDIQTECLNYRLKTVVLKGYRGRKNELQLAMFLVRSARVLRVMKFLCENDCNPSWLANQYCWTIGHH
ncbi:hypothetical protein GQ55_4G105900 [Panicum hallii var. hallii]|uniref:Uncharacterized protein n=1 Tax=Panicum hallii var. hallii TaxID=1504633 RepID=A0A2T7DXB1_9POAL|nr:hypothetical protein GQ55_4G105900 [Panicum hallii var. hallii]